MWLSDTIRAAQERRRAHALSRAVHHLPVPTRAAMLAAARDEVLIAGGYTNRHGNVCPALAAHRRGARGDIGEFPRAWDRFTGARRPRAASTRELEILRALLEESLSSGAPAEGRVPAEGRAPAEAGAAVASPGPARAGATR